MLRLARVAAVVLGLFSGATFASAHEIGATQATAAFAVDGSYRLTIAVDPDALLMRLRLLDGSTAATPADRAERDRQIAELSERFLSAVHVRFDGVLDAPLFRYH